jgi:hypothetical protein
MKVIDKIVDMSEDGGHSADDIAVMYFVDWWPLRFALSLTCTYPEDKYEMLTSEESSDWPPPKPENWKAEEKWEMLICSFLAFKDVSIHEIYESPSKEFDPDGDFENERSGWMNEHKSSFPGFAFEQIKPDKLFFQAMTKLDHREKHLLIKSTLR